MLWPSRFRVPGVSMFFGMRSCSLAALLVAANGCSRAEAGDHAERADVGFGQVSWEQYELPSTHMAPPGDDLATLAQHLPLLAQHGLVLVLHWPSTELRDEARWDLTRNAAAMGVAVHPWITLPLGQPEDADPSSAAYASTGYFPNATNADAWCAAARELMDSWLSQGLAPTTLLVDLEMRRELLAQFAMLTDADDVSGALTMLESNRDGIGAAGFARAKQTYADFVAAAHERGFRVTASTLSPLLDDFDPANLDDDRLRQGFQVPLDPSTPWDSISFQVQRTLYQSYAPTSYYVYHYARQARTLFGARAGVGLGLTDAGWAVDTPTYASGEDLRQDVEAALAAGIAASEIDVYSFYGMYKTGPAGSTNAAQWLQPPRTHPPGWSPAADLATSIIQTLQRGLRVLLAP